MQEAPGFAESRSRSADRGEPRGGEAEASKERKLSPANERVTAWALLVSGPTEALGACPVLWMPSSDVSGPPPPASLPPSWLPSLRALPLGPLPALHSTKPPNRAGTRPRLRLGSQGRIPTACPSTLWSPLQLPRPAHAGSPGNVRRPAHTLHPFTRCRAHPGTAVLASSSSPPVPADSAGASTAVSLNIYTQRSRLRALSPVSDPV